MTNVLFSLTSFCYVCLLSTQPPRACVHHRSTTTQAEAAVAVYICSSCHHIRICRMQFPLPVNKRVPLLNFLRVFHIFCRIRCHRRCCYHFDFVLRIAEICFFTRVILKKPVDFCMVDSLYSFSCAVKRIYIF